MAVARSEERRSHFPRVFEVPVASEAWVVTEWFQRVVQHPWRSLSSDVQCLRKLNNIILLWAPSLTFHDVPPLGFGSFCSYEHRVCGSIAGGSIAGGSVAVDPAGSSHQHWEVPVSGSRGLQWPQGRCGGRPPQGHGQRWVDDLLPWKKGRCQDRAGGVGGGSGGWPWECGGVRGDSERSWAGWRCESSCNLAVFWDGHDPAVWVAIFCFSFNFQSRAVR